MISREKRLSGTKNSIIVLLISLLILAGCSNDKVGLKGKVIFSDDKSPLPVGMVCFETDNYSARGDIKPDGTFIMSSLKVNDGLPPGTYRVYIANALKVLSIDEDATFAVTESLIDEKFAMSNTSGITVDVTSSTKYIEIEVERYQPKKEKK